MFELPTFCHYGLGSAGGGAWRELAAHAMTTGWVLTGGTENFPLMYHWRVLSGSPPSAPADDIDKMVAFWDGSPQVRARLDAIAGASASLMLFGEYVPQNLHDWLITQVERGGDALDAACTMIERELRTAVRFMNANGLLHFDAHFRNILTDGERLYVTDFGLATSPRFDLSADERAFLRLNARHDECYSVTDFVNRLLTAVTGNPDQADRVALIGRIAAGDVPETVPASVAALVRRHAPVALVMNEFYRKLYGESRSTSFPADVIRHLASADPVTAPEGSDCCVLPSPDTA
jgi:hypothetical protein